MQNPNLLQQPGAAPENPERFSTLDAMRGIAVMGILLMNIVSFSMPKAAHSNPMAWGNEGPADIFAWGAAFLFVDGKMRGLFSILFGASMALVIQRADERDGTGMQTHIRRMAWLLMFGLLHNYLVWDGDILTHYAACGFIALAFVNLDERELLKIALIGFALGTIWLGLFALDSYDIRAEALALGASREAMQAYHELLGELGGAGKAPLTDEVSLMRGGYAAIFGERFLENWDSPIYLLAAFGFETLGLFALGMLLLNNGFLTGAWPMRSYAHAAFWSYGLGLPPLVAMLGWMAASKFDPLLVDAIAISLSTPFRLLVTFGHAALAIMAVKAFARSRLMARIEATGRAAFTNYIGTSILMTTLFYGYGLGWYGQLSRWQAYAIVPLAWIIMLIWSKPWLDRFRYGPLEWLWRSLARGKVQPMRR